VASVCYVDTSALVKRYVEERGSSAFDDFCESDERDLVISPLVATEFTGTLQRRVRTGHMTARHASEARRRFLDDVVSGGWRMIEFEAAVFSRASDLMLTLGAPLATLDAMHLACALINEADALATSDEQLAAASRRAKLQVYSFE
jgi:predicted nucleic acid-binding protein